MIGKLQSNRRILKSKDVRQREAIVLVILGGFGGQYASGCRDAGALDCNGSLVAGNGRVEAVGRHGIDDGELCLSGVSVGELAGDLVGSGLDGHADIPVSDSLIIRLPSMVMLSILASALIRMM